MDIGKMISNIFIAFTYFIICGAILYSLYGLVVGSVEFTGNSDYDALIGLFGMFFGIGVVTIFYHYFVEKKGKGIYK